MIIIHLGSLTFEYNNTLKAQNYINYLKELGVQLVKKENNEYYYSLGTR